MVSCIDAQQAQSSQPSESGKQACLQEAAAESNDDDDLGKDDPPQAQGVSYAISATNLGSIFLNGPGFSIGSALHPDGCTPCVYYCFSKRGCNKGESCQHCHDTHKSKLRRKREQWKDDVRSLWKTRIAKKHSSDLAQPEVQAFMVEKLLPPAEYAVAAPVHQNSYGAPIEARHYASQCPGPPVAHLPRLDQNQFAVYGNGVMQPVPYGQSNLQPVTMLQPVPTGVPSNDQNSMLTGMATSMSMGDTTAELFTYNPAHAVATVGQQVALWPSLVNVSLLFAVAPELPRGLSVDTRTGFISGVALETTDGPVTHFVTACEPSAFVDKINIAIIDISIFSPQDPVARSFMTQVQPAVNMQEALAAVLQEELLKAVAGLRRGQVRMPQ